ncbi:MAG: hypothetical protein NVSMB1_11600 [Polyangiales bacterium]
MITDYDGTPLATAGDLNEAHSVAEFAVAIAKEKGLRLPHAISTTRGFVHVATLRALGRTFLVAAYSRTAPVNPVSIARIVFGAPRIMREGLSIHQAAVIPLVRRRSSPALVRNDSPLGESPID